jgi:hypothetical protein
MRCQQADDTGFGSLTNTGLGTEGLKDCSGKCGTNTALVPVSVA